MTLQTVTPAPVPAKAGKGRGWPTVRHRGAYRHPGEGRGLTGTRTSLRRKAGAATILWVSLGLLLTLAPGPATPAIAQPAFVTAPVTPEQALAAVDECAQQLRAGTFDHQRLTQAGWVSAIRSEGGDVDLRGYRHPENMILLNITDNANAADSCSVMAPTGRGLSLEAMRSALGEHFAARARREGGQTAWDLNDLHIVLKPMGSAGVIIELSPGSR